METSLQYRDFDLLDRLPGGVVISDDDTRIHYANKAAQELMRMDEAQLSRKRLFAHVHPADQANVKRYAQMLKVQKRMRTMRRFRRGDGTYIILERDTVRLKNGMQLSLCQDVSAETEKFRQIERFISIAGHELRNPLSSMQLTVETLLLLSEEADPSKQELRLRLLRELQEQIQVQARMISDFLDISKIAKGKVEIVPEPVDVRQILVEAVRHIAALTSRTYMLSAPVECIVRGDRDRLYQTFFNLLQNAAKYSPETTSIETVVAVSKDTCTVSITDHGIGIEHADQEHIFEEFFQAGDAHEGLGIGLFLASAIIKNHEGTLRVKSSPGKGSTFIISLPLLPV